MHHDLPLGSLTAFLAFFGINPHIPNVGRASFEAASMGVRLGTDDVVFRCNIVHVKNSQLYDFTAGQISNEDALAYIEELKEKKIFRGMEIYHSNSYRNVLVWRNCPWEPAQFGLLAPHEHVGERIGRLPKNGLQDMIDLWCDSIKGNLMLYPWGACKAVRLPQVPYKMAMITALDFLAGLAEAVGGAAIIPEGATGYANTNYGAKLQAFVQVLPHFDVVFVHLNAPDEEAHLQHLQGKIGVIEDIDAFVGLVLTTMLCLEEPWRLVVVPDHHTLVSTGKHDIAPVPFCLMSYKIEPLAANGFHEGREAERIVDQWRN
jgi:2,3-bisphosphoglycerate-independent phosphoglycerate mutase